jgi:hypothetical protein
MAYGPEAKALRRCTATRADGEPCRAWAVWDDSHQLCVAHAGRHHRGPLPPVTWRSRPTRYVACTCPAYQWPHRPGSGLCEWPNVYPKRRCYTPAKTHSWPRSSGATGAIIRILRRRYRFSSGPGLGRGATGLYSPQDRINVAVRSDPEEETAADLMQILREIVP